MFRGEGVQQNMSVRLSVLNEAGLLLYNELQV